jgi:hypothetical protein
VEHLVFNIILLIVKFNDALGGNSSSSMVVSLYEYMNVHVRRIATTQIASYAVSD